MVHPQIGLTFSENVFTCIFLGAGLGAVGRFLHGHLILRRLISSCGDVNGIVYKTPVSSLDELKLRILAAIETVTPQMLEGH
jgi:hypothetical protein